MSPSEITLYSEEQLTIKNALSRVESDHMVRTIIEGLHERPKHISSTFLYDARGSQLFEKITELPEYYPPRIEKRLLREYANKYQEYLPGKDIVELGSGDCSKISILFDALEQWQIDSLRYVPVDVSEYAIREAADELRNTYENLAIYGLIADFMTQLDALPQGKGRVFCFLGSTVGNLEPVERVSFFHALGNIMQAGDKLLLGVDMVKPVKVLEDAYDDCQNVTAAFNRNALRVVNNLAGTNFDPEKFEHVAFYRGDESRIEMHLKALESMTITSTHTPCSFHIEEGEFIHTENSYKFNIQEVKGEVERAGLCEDMLIQDPNRWFSLLQLTKPAR